MLLGSTLAFVCVQFYLFRPPGQPAGWVMLLMDAGVGVFLVVLAAFLGVQLAGVLTGRRH